MGDDMSMDFKKTLEHFEASKNEIDEEIPANKVINESIDTIDTIKEMTMDDVDITTVVHLHAH